VWLCSRRWLWLALVSLALAAMAALVVWLAQRGAAYDAPLWQIVLHRSMNELVRHPLPFIPLAARYAFELVVLATGFALVIVKREPVSLQVTLALALLSRAGVDVPAFALFLVIAGLLAALPVVPAAYAAAMTNAPNTRIK
jgi:hypothetical protein